MHILSSVTDNCSSWISGRGRMAVEMFSWPSVHARICRTWRSNSGPLACQANSLPIELPCPVNGRQGGVERYCCNVNCGATMTSEVKGLRWDEMMHARSWTVICLTCPDWSNGTAKYFDCLILCPVCYYLAWTRFLISVVMLQETQRFYCFIATRVEILQSPYEIISQYHGY